MPTSTYSTATLPATGKDSPSVDWRRLGPGIEINARAWTAPGRGEF